MCLDLRVALASLVINTTSVLVITVATRGALGLASTLLLAMGITAVVLIASVCVICWLDARLEGTPRMPPCGRCGAAEFDTDWTHGVPVQACRCGRRYLRRHRRCLEVLPGGVTIPYRRWRPFDRWLDEHAPVAAPVASPYRGSVPPA